MAHVILHVAYSVGQPTLVINPSSTTHPVIQHSFTHKTEHHAPSRLLTHTLSHLSLSPTHLPTHHPFTLMMLLSHTHHSLSHLLTHTLSHLSLSLTHLPTHHPFTLVMLLSLSHITHPATCSPTHYLTYHYHPLIYPHITRSLS